PTIGYGLALRFADRPGFSANFELRGARCARSRITVMNNRSPSGDRRIPATFCALADAKPSKPGVAGSSPAGRAFPKKFADFDRVEIAWRTQIEKSDQSGECAPELRAFHDHHIPA